MPPQETSNQRRVIPMSKTVCLLVAGIFAVSLVFSPSMTYAADEKKPAGWLKGMKEGWKGAGTPPGMTQKDIDKTKKDAEKQAEKTKKEAEEKAKKMENEAKRKADEARKQAEKTRKDAEKKANQAGKETEKNTGKLKNALKKLGK